jgi:2-C-methyl-D-erythritol 4-phosphate cytidylyltransferase
METEQDKMFLEVAGMPVVGHTWKRFDRHPDIDETVIVIRDDGREKFEELARNLDLKKPYSLTHGGSERQDSVANGIASVSSSCKMVSIQDGARPCTSSSLISKTIIAAKESGAAVASSKVTDTIKIADSRSYISRNVDRTSLWAVQTPQVFDLNIIRKALAAVRRQGVTVTDDTGACELIGQPVVLVPSSDQNPKVTTPEDLVLVELLLRQ